MDTKIYVGNLPYSVDQEQLTEVFAEFGSVKSVNVIRDANTGRSKGFAFVEMENQEATENAIKTLNNKELDGRNMKVSLANPQEKRRTGGSSFGGGRRDGGSRNRY